MFQVFSVKDGKFHRAAEPVTNETAFRPTKTACGIVVTPLNHFKTVEDAADYTGNRLHLFGCKKCGLDKPQADKYRLALLGIGAQHPAWSAEPSNQLVMLFNRVTAEARSAVGAVGDDDDARADWCAAELQKSK